MNHRQLQTLLSVAALFLLWFLPIQARTSGLPDRIPVHFGISGQPDRWGPSSEIFFLPVIGILLALVLTLVARFPGSFNYPVRVTDSNRERLQALGVSMIGWLKVEILATFAWIEGVTIHIARQGEGARFSGPGILLLLVPLLAALGTTIAYISAMNAAGRE